MPGRAFLTEGGTETELLYKWGFELPEFAVFPLLDNPNAVTVMRDMFRRTLDVAAKHGQPMLLSGLDYRASPDWGVKLGYSVEGLAEANLRSITFLREIAGEYVRQVPDIRIAGIVGPRGDAYSLNRTITAEEAEDYHAVQLETLRRAEVDLAQAMTFSNIPEAVGVTRAAQAIGVPLAILFTLDSTHRLRSGPSLREAIEAVDAETNHAPAFYGINCSHPVEFEPALEPGNWFQRVRCLRPNAAKMDKISLCKLGHLEEGDPVELGRLMGDLAQRYQHIDIWGGCCGTGPVHLEEIARNVLAVNDETAEA
jgi:S-methylmethionine-dependent homocysteine/selenocysteine methylase